MTDLLDGLGLIDLLVEGLTSNEVWDVVIVLLLSALLLLHALVALGQLAKRGKGIWAKLVEDTWDELGELLVLTGTVDGEGVGWNGGVNCAVLEHAVHSFTVLLLESPYCATPCMLCARQDWSVGNVPFGAAKWMTFPSDLNMLTSSMAWIGWTFIFLRTVWSFFSSTPEFFGLDLTLRLGVPFPLYAQICQPHILTTPNSLILPVYHLCSHCNRH